MLGHLMTPGKLIFSRRQRENKLILRALIGLSLQASCSPPSPARGSALELTESALHS